VISPTFEGRPPFSLARGVGWHVLPVPLGPPLTWLCRPPHNKNPSFPVLSGFQQLWVASTLSFPLQSLHAFSTDSPGFLDSFFPREFSRFGSKILLHDPPTRLPGSETPFPGTTFSPSHLALMFISTAHLPLRVGPGSNLEPFFQWHFVPAS